MLSYNISIVFQNEIRNITINSNSFLADIVKKSLIIYDLRIDQIKGMYFNYQNQNIFFTQIDDTKLTIKYSTFIEKFGNNIINFYISQENIDGITDKFICDYKEYMEPYNEQNNRNYFYRPTINITNYNYSSNPPVQPSTPANNTSTPANNTSTPQNNASTPQNNTQQSDTPQSSSNNLQFEFNYDYDPTRRQFYMNTQQTNSPFTNIMRSLGRNVLNSINTSNTTTGYLYPFGGGNATDEMMDQLHRILMGESPDQETYVLRENDIQNLNQGLYEDLKNNNHILNDCTQCSITLEEFRPDTEVISLPCRHAFKKLAISHWLLNSSNKCPVCRTVVTEGVPRNNPA